MSFQPAPIALFVYNRPRHVQQTIEALKANVFADQSELFIYSDAPKHPSDEERVQQVRQYVNHISGFKSVQVIHSERNLGLANSIIAGVSEVVEKFSRVIVLEDDLTTSPYFLQFMNEALEIYENDERVVSIHGYVYPVKTRLPETFFIRGADCWGWATWKRGWDIFDRDGASLLRRIRVGKLEDEFDLGGSYPYTRMLEDRVKGKNESWAVLWYASAFLKGKLTLYPGRSLVKNIGFDNTGRHSGMSTAFNVTMSSQPIQINRIAIEENIQALMNIKEYLHTTRGIGRGKFFEFFRTMYQTRK